MVLFGIINMLFFREWLAPSLYAILPSLQGLCTAEGLKFPVMHRDVYGRPDHRINLQPLNEYCFLMDNRGIVCLYLLIRSTPNRNWRWKTLSVPLRQELGSGKPQRKPLVVNTALQANAVLLNVDSPFMSGDTETPLRCSAFQFHCSSKRLICTSVFMLITTQPYTKASTWFWLFRLVF